MLTSFTVYQCKATTMFCNRTPLSNVSADTRQLAKARFKTKKDLAFKLLYAFLEDNQDIIFLFDCYGFGYISAE